MPAKDTSQGHRKRLRERFLQGGLAGFQDYEIVELLLTLGSPRKDCKQQAKGAIERFKTLRGVLEASTEELEEIAGIGPHNVLGIKLVQEAARRFLKERLIDRPVYQSSREIFDYLYHSMRDLKKEVFKVIYLNSRNQIIETADLFQGTVNSSAVSPRQVIEGAIKHNAVSVIFAHNHPSGELKPSNNDLKIHEQLVASAKILGLRVLDHLIVAKKGYYSFQEAGLIHS